MLLLLKNYHISISENIISFLKIVLLLLLYIYAIYMLYAIYIYAFKDTNIYVQLLFFGYESSVIPSHISKNI